MNLFTQAGPESKGKGSFRPGLDIGGTDAEAC